MIVDRFGVPLNLNDLVYWTTGGGYTKVGMIKALNGQELRIVAMHYGYYARANPLTWRTTWPYRVGVIASEVISLSHIQPNVEVLRGLEQFYQEWKKKNGKKAF